jgi:hypothetical protein
MDYLGMVLYWLGVGTILVAGVWSFVVVVRENPVPGVICLFLPFGVLVALMQWWPRTWRPIALWALGCVLFFGGLAASTPGGK